MKIIIHCLLFLSAIIYHNINSMDSKALTNLHTDILGCIILSHYSIEDSIKTILPLTATCTNFENIADAGRILRFYPQQKRQNAFNLLLKRLTRDNYPNTRRAFALLIHAEAENHKQNSFSNALEKAVAMDDKEMVQLIFRYGAHANQRDTILPTWYFIQTLEIAHVFEENQVELRAKDSWGNFTLWNYMLDFEDLSYGTIKKYPIELILYYFDKAFSPNDLDNDGNYITHWAATTLGINYDLLDKLLIKFPELVNKLNQKQKTPLDLANSTYKPQPKLIELLEKHGAKTSVELQEKNKITALDPL